MSGIDSCGQQKNVASCGSCFGVETCGGGGTPNRCGCLQSDADFCRAAGTTCGTSTGYDACNVYRSNVSCGACASPQTCSASNTCVCVPESTSALCARLSKNCGTVTAVDVCGTSLTVTCGSCTGTSSCGGGGTPNVCGCTPLADGALCASLGKSCGSLSVRDNCGQQRTLACGTCASGSTCGALGGSANTCLPFQPFPTSGVCTTNGVCFVQQSTPTVNLNDVFTEPNGDVWAVGEEGVVLNARDGGTSGLFRLRDRAFTAVLANGPNDVWVGGRGGGVLHFDGNVWQDVMPLPSTQTVTDLFRDSSGTTWVVGNFDPMRFSAQGVLLSTVELGFTTYQVSQLGNEVVLATTGGLYRAPMNGDDPIRMNTSVIDTLASASSSELYAGNSGYLSGYGYWASLSKWVGLVGTSISFPNSPIYTRDPREPVLAARSPSDVDYLSDTNAGWHFDGLTWAATRPLNQVPVMRFKRGHGSAGAASFVGERGLFISRTNGPWVKRHEWTVIPPLELATNVDVLPLSATQAMVRQTESVSTGARDAVAMLTPSGFRGVRVASFGARHGGFWSANGTAAWTTEATASSTALYRFDGTTWALRGSVTGSPLTFIGGVSETDLWLAGGSRMVRWNGSTFTDVNTPFTGTASAFSAAPIAIDANTAFAIVDQRTLLRWDGTTWSVDQVVPASTARTIRSLWKSPQGTVWLSGTFGLKRFSAGAWTTEVFSGSPGAIWGTSDTDVRVVNLSATGNDEARVWNGTSWSTQVFPLGVLQLTPVATGTATWFWNGYGILRK